VVKNLFVCVGRQFGFSSRRDKNHGNATAVDAANTPEVENGSRDVFEKDWGEGDARDGVAHNYVTDGSKFKLLSFS
jgi:hypothetical protein